MAYSRRQLDRWATWLDLETSYAITKFSTPEQLQYFGMGVDNGESSWASSAAGYLHRAGMLVSVDNKETRLRMALNMGKSAHNHIACAAVARVYYGQQTSLLEAYIDVQEEWKTLLDDVEPLKLTPSTGRQQGIRFTQLQMIQDDRDPEEFQGDLRRIALPVHAGFLALCEQIGWPQPGISSSEDVRNWQSCGDEDVERIIQAI